MKATILPAILLLTILLTGCQPVSTTETTSPESTASVETVDTTTPEAVVPELTITEVQPETEPEITEMEYDDSQADRMTTLGVPMPKTDGSTSMLPFDKAVHAALLDTTEDDLYWLTHTKTYTALDNLLSGQVDVLYRTPLSADERQKIADAGWTVAEEPVAGEGFVFVVNADNPVDSLTSEQLRDIYAGRITNWSEVGGEDLPILAYQRNKDSGSQNYMIAFMGETPLMSPLTDVLPASMTGLMDAVANYENSRGAIGYSVYSFASGMYADIAKVKYIQVDGVEPSFENMVNGTYPLLGYNYAIFDATLSADSPVRTVVRWIQSDEGQKIAAATGYVPYRHMDGLTLPETDAPRFYMAAGTGTPAGEADYDYEMTYLNLDSMPTFADMTVGKVILDYIEAEQNRLDSITEEEMDTFMSGKANGPYYQRWISLSLKNGYLSILSGMMYQYGYQDSPYYYYKPAGAVFDVYTGEKLAFTDLFPAGSDFVPRLNEYLAAEATTPYSGFGSTHDMIREFAALEEDRFVWTAEEIVFLPGDVFVDGVSLSLDGLHESMSISVPRDMEGVFVFDEDDAAVYKIIRQYHATTIGKARTLTIGDDTEATVWLLDENKAPLPPAVIEKINEFVLDMLETNYAREQVISKIEAAGYPMEAVEKFSIGPWADFYVNLYGKRYISVSGPNEIFVHLKEEYQDKLPVNENLTAMLPVMDTYDLYGYYTEFNFHALTGEVLTLSDLFADGWETGAKVYGGLYDRQDTESQDFLGSYTDVIGDNAIVVRALTGYDRAPGYWGTVADLAYGVEITVTLGDTVYTIVVDREYIK